MCPAAQKEWEKKISLQGLVGHAPSAGSLLYHSMLSSSLANRKTGTVCACADTVSVSNFNSGAKLSQLQIDCSEMRISSVFQIFFSVVQCNSEVLV